GSKRDGMVPALVVNNVAGMSGLQGAWSEGEIAKKARVTSPQAVAVGPDGSVYVYTYFRIARITPDGIIETHAGNGPSGSAGDGGPATAASVRHVFGMVVASDGTLYFAENGSPPYYVRKVAPDGIISRVVGIPGNSASASGDGGPATA